MTCELCYPGCECRYFSPFTGKYLGFCREGDLHPLNYPFNPEEVTVQRGPFRHQERERRKND